MKFLRSSVLFFAGRGYDGGVLLEPPMMGRIALVSTALLLAGSVVPALAADDWVVFDTSPWWAIRHAIYETGNRVAFLQADPEIDDGYKGPIITWAQREIRKLHATLPAAHWQHESPCCYARRPIHIR